MACRKSDKYTNSYFLWQRNIVNAAGSIHAIGASCFVVTTKTRCVVQLHWERKDYTHAERKGRTHVNDACNYPKTVILVRTDSSLWTLAYSIISRDLGSLKLFRTRKIIQFND